MNPVEIRGVKIGGGIPKICVPVVGVTKDEVIEAAKEIQTSFADLVEWRADWYEDIFDEEKTREMLETLRNILGEIPVLFTFRTLKEGGEKEISTEQYRALNKLAACSGYVDMVDVEAFTGDDAVKEMIEEVHQSQVKVIASNHDFQKTPGKDDMIARLCKMQALGADICKIAVMPQNRKDVLTLLAATEEMVREYADRPVITMSMAGDGSISRLCGEVFGSAVTFGTVGKASAPGQIEAVKLQTVLHILHDSIEQA